MRHARAGHRAGFLLRRLLLRRLLLQEPRGTFIYLLHFCNVGSFHQKGPAARQRRDEEPMQSDAGSARVPGRARRGGVRHWGDRSELF